MGNILGFPIRPGATAGVQPTHLALVWADLSQLPDGTTSISYNPDTSCVYQLRYLRRFYGDPVNVQQFAVDVRKYANGGPNILPPPQDNPGLNLHIDPDNPTSFTIKGNCYIVLAIETANWQFNDQGPALTAMDKTLLTRYGDLMEAPDGGPTVFPVPGDANFASENCRVIYFSAAFLANQQNDDHFYMYAALQGMHALDVKPVDPDIKNDGTVPNWPP